MSTQFQPSDELVDLIVSAVDGRLSPDEHRRLESLTAGDREARQFFVDFLQLHAVFQRRALDLFVDQPTRPMAGRGTSDGAAGCDARAHVPKFSVQSKSETTRVWTFRRTLSFAACVGGLLIGGLTLFGPFVDKPVTSSADKSIGFVGVVRLSEDAAFEGDRQPPSEGALLPNSVTRLRRGKLVVETFSGALLTLFAPCDVEFDSESDLVDCRSGSLAVEAIDPDCELTVRTPVGELLHIGTEYQIAVDQETGETKLEVYDGGVRLQSELLAAAPGSARVFSPGAAVSMRPTGQISKLDGALDPLVKSHGLLPPRPLPYISNAGFSVSTVLAPGDNYHPPEPDDVDAPRIFTIAAAEAVYQQGRARGDVIESHGIRQIDFQDGYAKPQYAEMLASYVNLFNVDARPPAFAEGSEPRNCFVMQIRATFIVEDSWEYSFIVNSDDGCRLRVDGQDVIFDEGIHPPQQSVGTLALAAGEHQLELLAYDDHGFHRLELGVASGRTLRSDRFTLLKCHD